jgi:HK97 family phage portal protein
MRGLVGGLWNAETGPQRSGPWAYSNEAGQGVSDSRALQISAVFRSIRIIAEVAGMMPMIGYKKLANGDRQELPESHWLQQLICYPNETQTGDEWRETMFAQMAGWGQGYSQVVPNAAGRATELWAYKTGLMEVSRLTDRTLQYKYPDMRGVQQVMEPERVLHLRMFSPDGVMGLSPLAVARESLGLAVGAERYASSFFAEGGRPAGVMTSDKLLTDKQREQIRKEFGGIGGMNGDTGRRFWVLEGSLKYQPITVSPEDMQMLQTRQFQISDIARFFGVPLFLLMETSKDTSWGSGLEQLNLAFLAYTLNTYLNRMKSIFNMRIIPPADRSNLFVDIDTSPLTALDSTALKELLASYGGNGVMTRNEIRRRIKLPQSDEPNADKLTVQTALTTIDKLGQLPPKVAPFGGPSS